MIYAIHGKLGAGKDTLGSMLKAASMKYVGTFTEYLRFAKRNPDPQIGLIGLAIMKFADPLKEMVALATGCTRTSLEDNDFKNSYLPITWNHTVNEAWVWLYSKNRQEWGSMKDDLDIINAAGRAGFRFRRTYREFLIEVGMKMREVHPDFWINSLMSRYQNIGHDRGVAITDLRFANEFFYLKSLKNTKLIKIVRPGSEDKVPEHVRTSDSETSLDEIPDDQWDKVIVNDGTLEDLYAIAQSLIR